MDKTRDEIQYELELLIEDYCKNNKLSFNEMITTLESVKFKLLYELAHPTLCTIDKHLIEFKAK